MKWADEEGGERGALMRKVWEKTPWMVNAYTGDPYIREIKMLRWCQENFGPEAWPIHGKPGKWYRGGATVNGWTRMGFETEAMMNKFCETWPAPEGVGEDGRGLR
jgi:hypothetical protein